MSRTFVMPKYLENKIRYVVELPFVQTSGAPGSIYEWNNAAHAALHSILTGLIHARTKRHLRYWLGEAKASIGEAVRLIDTPRAKVLPRRAAAKGGRR